MNRHGSCLQTAFSALCAMLLLLLPSCREKTTQQPPPAPKVTVAQPLRRTVTDNLELTGNTQATRTVQLVARVSGYLEKLFFYDGQLVQEGQLLFLVQQNTYHESIRQADASILQFRAQLDYAEAQLKRYSSLVQREAVSQSEVDNWEFQRNAAQANLKSAMAQRELAALNLSYTEIRAPFSGRIDRRLVDPGNLVGQDQSTALAQLNQIDPIYVYFNITDTDLARLTNKAHWTPGRVNHERWPVFVGFPEEQGFPHVGYVDFAATSLTSTTGSLLLRGILPNPSGRILPGLYARVRVPLEKKTAFVIPDEAISYDQQGAFALIVDGKNIVQRRGVQTGALVENMRVIAKGLDGSEQVIVQGLLRSVPGRPVAPEREGETASAAAPAQKQREK